MEFTYKGLTEVVDHYTVTDAEVDTQLERLHQQTPKVRVITDRPAQNGDELLLDYEGWCGETRFAGGTAQQQTLVLGSGQFIAGFEEQLLGTHAGDKVDVFVTFPEPYHAAELAGQKAVFHCLVHEIRESSAYELNDEFAQALGIPSLDRLREALRESIQSYTDERGQRDVEDRLIRQAAQTLDFAPTEAELEQALNEQMDALEGQLAQQGLHLEMYAQFLGKTLEELREDQRGDACENLRIRYTIEKIVALEGITVSEEEMATAVADTAKHNDMTVEEMQPYMSEEFMAAIQRSVETKKAVQVVYENANLTPKN